MADRVDATGDALLRQQGATGGAGERLEDRQHAMHNRSVARIFDLYLKGSLSSRARRAQHPIHQPPPTKARSPIVVYP